MPVPVPQTTAREIGAELELLLKTKQFFDPNDPAILTLERKSKTLAKVSQGEGNVMLAAVAALCGNACLMQSRYAIARNQGLETTLVMNHVTSLCRLGMFVQAGEIIRPYTKVCNELILVTSRAMLSMRFMQTAVLFQHVKALNLEVDASELEAFKLAEEVAKAMAVAQITDEMMAELNELAGQIMREHGVCRGEDQGLFAYEGDDGLPCFSSTMNLAVSFEQASEMNMQLAERYAASNIAISPVRYTVRFAGGYEYSA